MAQAQHTHSLVHLEEALSVLFCLIDDAYAHLNPRGAHSYESIKRLSDSEVIALALFQQLRGVHSERSFLRDAQRFFSHLFPGVARLHPSSFNRRVKKLRRYLEPLRREIGYRASRAATRGKTADRDRPFEPQEDLWPGRDFGHHACWAGNQDLKAKIAAYTYAFVANRVLGRPQGHIKELWV
jgi:hypothetical protein